MASTHHLSSLLQIVSLIWWTPSNYHCGNRIFSLISLTITAFISHHWQPPIISHYWQPHIVLFVTFATADYLSYISLNHRLSLFTLAASDFLSDFSSNQKSFLIPSAATDLTSHYHKSLHIISVAHILLPWTLKRKFSPEGAEMMTNLWRGAASLSSDGLDHHLGISILFRWVFSEVLQGCLATCNQWDARTSPLKDMVGRHVGLVE